MEPWAFLLALLLTAAVAGGIGAILGLGGGILLVPTLTMFYGVSLRYAMGASIISVIATSSGAAAAYLRSGLTNIRIGLFLAMATVGPIGASQPGFSTSPFALGTPFGMPFTPAQWDATFGTKAREAQEPAPGAGQSETGPAPSTFGVDATSGMANVAKRGGLVRGSLRDRLDDKRYLLQSGEYVIRRASVAKYRTLLDAINRDRPTEVRRLASKLQARLVA